MSQSTPINTVAAAELGRRLADLRNQQGLSLEDLAGRLKLSSDKLAALEKGNYAALPEMVYVRGFLRNYARVVGMGEQEVGSYLDKIAPVVRQDMSALEKNAQSRNLAYLENRSSIPGWVAGLLAFGVLAGGIYFWQSKSISRQESNASQQAASAALQNPNKPKTDNVAVVPMAASPAAASAASAPVAATASAASAASGVLVVAADELYIKPRYRTLLIVKDKTGKEVFNGLALGGSEQRFRGAAPYDVRIGYVQGSTVNYGGKIINYGPFMIGRTTAAFKAGE